MSKPDRSTPSPVLPRPFKWLFNQHIYLGIYVLVFFDTSWGSFSLNNSMTSFIKDPFQKSSREHKFSFLRLCFECQAQNLEYRVLKMSFFRNWVWNDIGLRTKQHNSKFHSFLIKINALGIFNYVPLFCTIRPLAWPWLV